MSWTEAYSDSAHDTSTGTTDPTVNKKMYGKLWRAEYKTNKSQSIMYPLAAINFESMWQLKLATVLAELRVDSSSCCRWTTRKQNAYTTPSPKKKKIGDLHHLGTQITYRRSAYETKRVWTATRAVHTYWQCGRLKGKDENKQKLKLVVEKKNNNKLIFSFKN